MKVKDEAKIKIIYFSDEEVSNQVLIFDGTALQVREQQFGYDWDGFSLGDSFHLNDDKVRVYEIEQKLDTGEALYIIGPESINPNKIDFKKINK
ncbi:hypothetical protein M5V91_14610 [Cytobacillus pseudoceanisediminis]|uniref:hypothetical protein n=1 Tax=Cytobacillus pseudoceanisediminis TaxID=3051614 RepID=UPI0021889401|nr:hypothetical protein [Cytobacillus pseudoceanisediminis]UQX52295.1 hypothetical protein M5V91_14610 [Cytobacillus pseudoceanisediminis]